MRVVDRDDGWTEGEFRDELRSIGRDPVARVVVVRTGSTERARERWARMCVATHRFVILPHRDVLVDRVRHGNRADRRHAESVVDEWLAGFDPVSSSFSLFPGWDAVQGGEVSALGAGGRQW